MNTRLGRRLRATVADLQRVGPGLQPTPKFLGDVVSRLTRGSPKLSRE